MRKILFTICALTILSVLSSCEKDQSLDPRPQLVSGQFVRLELTYDHKYLIAKSSAVINPEFTDAEIQDHYFGGMLTNPSGNVKTYNLYVKKVDLYNNSTEYKLVKTVTSFPYDLRVTLADIASALGLTVNDIKALETFYFYGESFDAKGNRAAFNNLSATVQSAPTMFQGYRFRARTFAKSELLVPANYREYDNYVAP